MIYDDDISLNQPSESLLAFLLMGLLRIIIAPFQSRAEFRAYREQAYRVRAAVRNIEHGLFTDKNNNEVLTFWSGDDGCDWRKRMSATWQRAVGRFRFTKPPVRALQTPRLTSASRSEMQTNPPYIHAPP